MTPAPANGDSFQQHIQATLAQRQQTHLYRQRYTQQAPQGPVLTVDGRQYLGFCSNDYLGLSQRPELVAATQQALTAYGVGSGAAHLVCGHSELHQQLEQRLAQQVGRPRALLFSTGYMANNGLIPALVGRKDLLLQDKLNHASLLDGGLLSRAKLSRYRHADVAHVQQLLQSPRQGRCLLVTDAVFSMDGDIAPLPALAEQFQGHDAWLMVDDAHGFGVLGEQGAGSCAHFGLSTAQVPVYMATLGKALGAFGAFVAGESDLIEYLIQEARPYIYTTAAPPAWAAAVMAGLDVLQQQPQVRQQLWQRVQQFRQGAEALDLPLMASQTPIQPLWVGEAATALALSEQLRERGFWVSAIRYPTVPQDQARLRVTLSAAHTAEQVDQLLDALAAIMPRRER